MNKYLTLSAGLVAILLSTGVLSASAQLISETTPTPTASGTIPADVKPGDWAYQAIQDCAAKGLIAGYPPDGDFLGGHAITRYEAATIVARLLDKVDALAATPGAATGEQAQIDEISKLSDDFKLELTVIGTNMTQAQADIKTLQDDVTTLQAGLGSAYDALEEQKAQITKIKADVGNSYGNSSSRKFNITGYIQARFVSAFGGNDRNFPNGQAAAAGAYNGFYAQGGSREGFEVRRARLKFSGQLTANTSYAAQFDFSGAVAPATTKTSTTGSTTTLTSFSPATQQLTTREAWVAYTFGDGSASNPTLTAGQFATPYGYILPGSTAAMITPERPLAFSEGSVGSPFNAEDYDKGIKLAYSFSGINLTAALVNGDGRNSENLTGTFSDIIGATYSVKNMPFTATLGACYFNGHAFQTNSTIGGSAQSDNFPQPKKDLVDVNAQVSYDNFFMNAELEKGTFEQVSAFSADPPTLFSSGLTTTSYVKGNTILGDYLCVGYNFNSMSNHPLTFAFDYDTFQRSISAKAAGFGNASYDDVNYGYGALYNLDKATRLRLWYDEPSRVAHTPSTNVPFPALGLFTAELQVKF
jgi:hypothetical protein